VHVEATGYAPRELQAEITAGETSELDVTLDEGSAEAQ
jgi:hypothetical protein